MENTTTNKEITAEEMLDNTIKSYNSQASDLHKFAFNKKEKELFCGMMNYFASLQTEAKDRENAELKAEKTVLLKDIDGSTKERNSFIKSIWKMEAEIVELKEDNFRLTQGSHAKIAELESSLSLSKKENEELKKIITEIQIEFDENGYDLPPTITLLRSLDATRFIIKTYLSELTSVKKENEELKEIIKSMKNES